MAGTMINSERAPTPSTIVRIGFIAVSSRSIIEAPTVHPVVPVRQALVGELGVGTPLPLAASRLSRSRESSGARDLAIVRKQLSHNVRSVLILRLPWKRLSLKRLIFLLQ